MFDDQSRYANFPTLQNMVYLNTAAEGIPPTAVGNALAEYFRDAQQGMDGRDPHFAAWEAAKQQVAAAFALQTDEVGICSCSSEAFNLAAMALQLREGDEIVINDLDFPAGSTPWLQESCPATVKVWRAREWGLHVEDLVPLLGPRTRLVSTSLVSFFNGFMIHLPEVIEAVRANTDALFALDVTQALGRIPLDLTDVDLIISSTHKWILASHGGGLVGIPSRRAEELRVPAGGWFHLKDAFGESRFDQAISLPGAQSFTVGMPNFPAVYAIRSALEYIHTIGVEQIHQHAQPLLEACLEGLCQLPIELITPQSSANLAGILAFRHERAEELHRQLRAADVHVMSHVYAARALLPDMIERGEGYLLQMASAAGLLSQIGDAAYSATKHAAVGFAESIAISHGDDGVKVSLVCPQYVATPLLGYDDATEDGRSAGTITAAQAAQIIVDGVKSEKFLILTHPDVHTYFQHKAADTDRWISGMQRLRRNVLSGEGGAETEEISKLI